MTTEKPLPKADVQTLKEFKFQESIINTCKEDEAVNKLNRLFNEYDWFDEIFEKDGKVGIKDITGSIVVPPKFDGCDAVQSILFRQPSMPMTMDGKKYLVKTDGSGDVLSEGYFSMQSLPWSQLLVVKNSIDGKVGLINRKGEMIAPVELDSVHEPFNGYVAVKAQGKYGFIYNDHLYIRPAYDEIELPAIGENLKVKKSDVWGFLTEEGAFTLDEDQSAWGADMD